MKARSTDLSTIAKMIALSGGNLVQASYVAESTRAPESVQVVLRAAVDAGTTSDPAFAAALVDSGIVGAFVEALRSKSIFARMLIDGGLVRMPLRTSAAVVAADASGYVVGERMPVPVSALALSGPHLAQHKAAGLIVISSELVRSISPAARALLDNSLRAAVGSALDAKFIDLITDGITSLAASGATAAAALVDLRALLDLVNHNAGGALYWLMPANVANAGSTLAAASGHLMFPGLSPTGGELLGVPVLVSDAVLDGHIMLVDASGIGGEIETVSVSVSQEATIQMDSAPNSPPNAGAVMTSLWQTNRSALLATAHFGAERFRSNAVAVLDGISWGDAP
ncbi:phage major capsid protein [Bosea sp. LjRoot237]|uniref:phage major capsid protein n=1 Tax=Bosea sp. LjRoot237 TaxID=3342292 RepID=UPI003ED0D57D